MRIRNLVAAIAIIPVLSVATIVFLAIINGSGRSDAARFENKSRYLENLENNKNNESPPNIIVILYDDLGYGDFGVYGNRAYQTPAIDELAQQGARFTNYYSAAPSCTPSRAGLLTGRYPLRSGLIGVVFPHKSLMDWAMRAAGITVGMPRDEILLPEVLHAAGYRTTMVGKWHLGDTLGSLPNDFGFDDFYGARYSNDMKPFALYKNDKIHLPAPVDQSQLNDIYTNAVVSAIDAKGNGPFFIYFAHNMPHEPLSANDRFVGRSGAGIYGDVLTELDDGVRRIVETLKNANQLDNTLILITSDNGPWFEGSTGGHRGRKGGTFEGGMRVPMIVHWPAHIKPAVIDTPASGVDILPTILDYLALSNPSDRQLDGNSWRGLLENAGTTNNGHSRPIYYFAGDKLLALRRDSLKYQARKSISYWVEPSRLAFPNSKGPWLFNLNSDPFESYNLLNEKFEKHPLASQFDAAKQDFLENPRGWIN